MSSKIQIRPANPKDYSFISELYLYGDSLHFQGRPDIFLSPEKNARPEDDFKHRLSQSAHLYIVAECQGQVIGVLHGFLKDVERKVPITPRKLALLESIIVNEKFQNEKVGTRLVSAFFEWAKASGSKTAELSVFNFNQKAFEWYKKLGFNIQFVQMDMSLEK